MDTATLRNWYESLTASAVRAMKGSAQENRLLDFKLASERFDSKEDKRNLAAALSGFANAEGGVIVWGVDARKDKEADQVVETPGVAKPHVLLSRLTELTAQACSPVPAGIDHRVIQSRRGHSFVATFVPESDGGPHMARLGEDRYYVRAGGSFLRMEHFQVADMFGRRARPSLSVELVPHGGQYAVELRMTNSGRGSAVAPYLELTPSSPFGRHRYGINGNGDDGMPHVRVGPTGDLLRYATGTDYVLHPSMTVRVCALWLGNEDGDFFKRALPTECTVRFKCGALGLGPIEGTLTLPVPHTP